MRIPTNHLRDSNQDSPLTTHHSPRIVSPFEGKLLRLVRSIVRQLPVEQALPVVAERTTRPSALSRACVELAQDSLAKGCLAFLVRAGGWRRERFLRDGQPREGRLWELSTATDLALVFSRHSLEFLLWLTAQKPADTDPPMRVVETELTVADRLLIFLTYDALRDTEAARALRARALFAEHGLIRLAFPEDFAGVRTEPDFEPWSRGQGALIVEALQPWLAKRWVSLVRGQSRIGDWPALGAVGREQERVLSGFTDAAERANRPDLVRFVLQTAGVVLAPTTSANDFFSGLQGSGPPKLAERIDVHRRALALPRHLDRLRSWERRARGVGFLDEDYAASQLWKADWERLNGEDLASRADELLRQVEPIKVS